MGQAKLRGTFEQRQAEGIAKRLVEEQRKREEAAARKAEADAWRKEREARMTPQDRDRCRRAGVLLASVLGMAISSSSAKGLEMSRMAAEYGR